ncbi:MAG: DUF190 domain-containing protein [Methanosarcinales archaeon]|nr:DUF190 domain-containing protein [Methanosarcinales archaeon]
MEFDNRYIIRIYMRDSDRHEGKLVQHEILDYLREMNVAGATVIHGSAGFSERRFAKDDICELPKGANIKSSVSAITTEHPIIIECIEKKEKMGQVLPRIRDILGTWGMITVMPVHVLV